MNIPPDRVLILASTSPRRRELLASLSIPFRVIPPEIEEDDLEGESPTDSALRLARAKAQAVAPQVKQGLILGVDTVVTIDGDILGKPASPKEAKEMLSRLSSRTHQVISAMHLLSHPEGKFIEASPMTEVTFNHMTEAQIEAYVKSGEPLDKAGAYAIQGLGSVLVQSICGCYFNVVGLSLPVLAGMLARFGWEVL